MSSRVEISKKLVLINSASSIAARVLNISVLVWLQQYLLAHISAEEYSLYPLLVAVLVFVPLITSILTWGLGRYVVEAYARGDEQRVTRIVSTMVPLLSGVALLLVAGGALLAWNIDRFLTIAPERVWDARFMLMVMVFSAAARLPLAPYGLGLYVRQKFVLQNSLQVVAELMRIGLLLTLLLGVSTRVIWVPVAQAAAYLSIEVVRIIISRRLIPALRWRRGMFDWSIAREVSTFGAWNFVNQAAETVRTAADPIILNKLAGAAAAVQVTCFHLGHLAYYHIAAVAYMATGPVKPVLTALHATGDRPRLGRAYVRGCRYGLWTALLAGVPLMVFAREFFTLYTDARYLPAATVMTLLLAQYPLSFTSLLLPSIAEAQAQLRAITLISLLMNVLNIGLSIYLVGALGLGAMGAALARLIISILSQPLYMPLGIRLAGVSWRTWLRETLWLGWAPALAAAPVWLAARWLLRPDDWLSLGACFLLGAVAYLGSLLLFCLEPHERADLRRVAVFLRLAPAPGS